MNTKMNPRINTLLTDLPDSEFQILSPHLELVSLTKAQILFRSGEITHYVYYPVGAIISMMIDMQNGSEIETFMLGRTCVVGMGAVDEPSFYRAIVRNTGLAYRMHANELKNIQVQCPTYNHNAQAAINKTMMQLSQTLACFKFHSIEEQLIRWILIGLDRGIGNTIEITHQELGDVLGFRREGITLTLGKLSHNGELALSRGAIQVLDRRALEARSCECYWIGQQRQRT